MESFYIRFSSETEEDYEVETKDPQRILKAIERIKQIVLDELRESEC